MDFSILEKGIRDLLEHMDRGTLSDLKNDPFVLVTCISNGGLNTASFSLAVSEKDSLYIYNEFRLQTLLGEAMLLTAEAVKRLPNNLTITCRSGQTRIIKDSSGCAIVISVISNRDDANWIAEKIKSYVVSFILTQ